MYACCNQTGTDVGVSYKTFDRHEEMADIVALINRSDPIESTGPVASGAFGAAFVGAAVSWCTAASAPLAPAVGRAAPPSPASLFAILRWRAPRMRRCAS